MEYSIKTSSYNDRRYGRPWIAEVRGKEFLWGEFEGRPGEAGRLVIEVEPGALIAQGQKDTRKGRGGVDYYYMAMPNGKLWSRNLDTESNAKAWAKKGWQKYAEARMNDITETSHIRYIASRLLGVQCPLDAVAADVFGLVKTNKTEPLIVSMDAFL